MAIINIYDELEKGVSIKEAALESAAGESLFHKPENIFISHKSSDKKIARIISKQLEDKGYGVYLDENDLLLQMAAQEKDNERVVEAIKTGINDSQHILVIVSDETRESWWVPYEIGIADSYDKNILSFLPDVLSRNVLPEYLKIKKIVRSYEDLKKEFPNLMAGSWINSFLDRV